MTSTNDELEGFDPWGPRVEVSTVDTDGYLLIGAGGDIDFVTAPRLYERVRDEVERAHGMRVVLDLGDVRFIDSSGLGLIVRLWKTARANGGDLGIARPRENCVMLLERTGLAERIVMAPTVDEAATRLPPGDDVRAARAVG